MSHNRNHIIISALVATGQFDPTEVATLEEIAGKEEPRCSVKDADTVAHIVRAKLRQPPE